MDTINQARERLARAAITGGKKLASLVCPHSYVHSGRMSTTLDANGMEISRFICILCGADTTNPPLMDLLIAWFRERLPKPFR